MPNHDRFECQTAIDSDAILQLNVDKQNSSSVRRVLYQKQEGPDAPEGG